MIVGITIIVGGYFLYKDDFDDNGKLYSTKERLCTHFAQSYLRTVQKTDKARNSENISSSENQRWQMAVDIETDFYNLCTLNLEEKSLKTYKSTIIEKYQK
ncbi:hypothetical protein KJ909_01210 [Patescibacteria group bacterium]|nr:hypothetical protein [Patescibacteria group bacterium]